MFYWYMTNICLAYNSTTDNKFRLNIIKAFPMHCEIIDTESVTKILTMLFNVYKDNTYLFTNHESLQFLTRFLEH